MQKRFAEICYGKLLPRAHIIAVDSMLIPSFSPCYIACQCLVFRPGHVAVRRRSKKY